MRHDAEVCVEEPYEETAHESHLAGHVDVAHQIGQEEHGALEHRDQQQLTAGVVAEISSPARGPGAPARRAGRAISPMTRQGHGGPQTSRTRSRVASVTRTARPWPPRGPRRSPPRRPPPAMHAAARADLAVVNRSLQAARATEAEAGACGRRRARRARFRPRVGACRRVEARRRPAGGPDGRSTRQLAERARQRGRALERSRPYSTTRAARRRSRARAAPAAPARDLVRRGRPRAPRASATARRRRAGLRGQMRGVRPAGEHVGHEVRRAPRRRLRRTSSVRSTFASAAGGARAARGAGAARAVRAYASELLLASSRQAACARWQ